MKNITLELHSILDKKINIIPNSLTSLDIEDRLRWKLDVTIDQELDMSLAITLVDNI